jgi:hypothetical protein
MQAEDENGVSPALNGGAVASMIELFDAMYDAEAFSLGDFATPAGGTARRSNAPTFSSALPPPASADFDLEQDRGDSMACEADEASPTQARIRDDVGAGDADSVASPFTFRPLGTTKRA